MVTTEERIRRALDRIASGTPVKTACRAESLGVRTIYERAGGELAEALARTAEKTGRVDPFLRESIVLLARNAGWTYAEISGALGITRARAHQIVKEAAERAARESKA